VRARQSEYGFTDHAERYFQRRAVVVGGATVDLSTTMIIGIVLALVGLAYLCWLQFTLAVMRLHGSLRTSASQPGVGDRQWQ
jgi:uncharacterized membrane protein YhaH (DUF805 family)